MENLAQGGKRGAFLLYVLVVLSASSYLVRPTRLKGVVKFLVMVSLAPIGDRHI